MEKNCSHFKSKKVRFLRAVRQTGMTHDVSLMKCEKCGQEFEDALTRSNTVFDLWFLNQSVKKWDYIEIFKSILGLPHPAEGKPISELERSKYWKSRLEPCEHIGRALVVTSEYRGGTGLLINGVYILDDSGLSENLIGLLKEEAGKK